MRISRSFEATFQGPHFPLYTRTPREKIWLQCWWRGAGVPQRGWAWHCDLNVAIDCNNISAISFLFNAAARDY